MKTGTEGLTGKSEEKKSSSKPAEKKHGDKNFSHIQTKVLDDGTVHHTHHYTDKHGMPHHEKHEYSSATAQDAGDHMTDQLAANGAAQAPQQADPAAAAQADPNAAAEAAPAAQAPAAGAPQEAE